MKDIEIQLWFNDFPDYLNDITIKLPFVPIVGDHIDFIFDDKPDWVNATPEERVTERNRLNEYLGIYQKDLCSYLESI